MTPEQQAIIRQLLMQGGQMTPQQQYQNAVRNSEGGMHPARQRYMAGNPVAKEPFDPLESLSAPQAMEQALMGGESLAPATSPRPAVSPRRAATRDNMMEGAGMDPDMRAQAGPDLPVMNRGQWMFDDPAYEAMWRDLSPEDKAIVMQRIQSGSVGSLDEAFAPQGFTNRR